MGLANLVSSAYPVPGVEMTLIAQTGDPQSGPAGDKYIGLDRFCRLVDKRWIKTGTSNPIVDLVRAQYTYDRANNRLTHTNPVATAAGVNLDQSYGYDGLYQVATHQTGIGTGIPATEEQFTYDPTGNWNRYKTLAAGAVTEDTPRTNNSANQITQIAGTPELIAHNATGNTTRIPKPADPTKSFDLKWDAWNRLVGVADSETGNPVAVYTYDGLYRRISTDDGNGTDTRRYYYNQQWHCVEEFNGEDSAAKKLLKRYFWGAQNRWELIARQRDTDGNETLDEELFVLSDAMDPVAIVNSSGNVEECYGYSAFGETTYLNPNFTVRTTGSAWEWNLLFHVEFRDETGLYNYGYRYYHAKLGRWLSRDPIEERGGVNLYGFGSNNAIQSIDVLGLEPLTIWNREPTPAFDSPSLFPSFVSLKPKTEALPIEGYCGNMERAWRISWEVEGDSLNPNKTLSGFVIQSVDVKFDATYCGKSKKAGEKVPEPKWTKFFPFTEAFQLRRNGIKTSSDNDSFKTNEEYPVCTKGTIEIRASASFHLINLTRDPVGDEEGPQLPLFDLGFDVNKKSPAGDYPMKPGIGWWLPGRHSNTINRSMTVTWDCCEKRNKT